MVGICPERQEVKVGVLTKKAQNKSFFFTNDTYKKRVFVLDSQCLIYYGGSLKKRGTIKGTIALTEVLAVETLLDQKAPNCGFQVSYEEDGRPLILYIFAQNQEGRDEWIQAIRDEALKSGAFFILSYHPACWDRHHGFSCCGAHTRGDEGCMPVTRQTAEMRERLLSKASSVNAGEILVDMMYKRSQGKSYLFGAVNFKERIFVLDSRSLRYFGGNLKKREGQKGSIELCTVLAVENVTENLLDNRKNAFQVVYEDDDGEQVSLVIVARSGDKRQMWILSLREEAKKSGAKFQSYYHPGVWMKGLGKFNCCQHTDSHSMGCQPVTISLTGDEGHGQVSVQGQEVRVGQLMKRAQNKSPFTLSTSYKTRLFVLDPSSLRYFDGNNKKRGQEKCRIPLSSVTVVAPLEPEVLDGHQNAFQVVYWDEDDSQMYLLYLVTASDHERHAWLSAIFTEAERAGSSLSLWYHSGVWNKRLGKFSCCGHLSRDAQGCCQQAPLIPSAPPSPSPSPRPHSSHTMSSSSTLSPSSSPSIPA